MSDQEDENVELQQEEYEMLRSIYSDKFINKDESQINSYSIALNMEESDFGIILHVVIPKDYPSDAIPKFSLESRGKKLKKNHLEDLKTYLLEQAEELQGDLCMMTICDETLEFLFRLSEEMEEHKEEKLEELNRFTTDIEANMGSDIGIGTPVTKENFIEWRKSFLAEMMKSKVQEKEKSKITGKQMWQAKLMDDSLFDSSSDDD